jgi:hypothetical protein
MPSKKGGDGVSIGVSIPNRVQLTRAASLVWSELDKDFLQTAAS